MPAHVILVHDDQAFSDDLMACLRIQCHDIRHFSDLSVNVPTLRASDFLEVAIVRPADRRSGIRIKVVGIPAGEPYAGPLVKALTEPVKVSHVMDALDAFLLPRAPGERRNDVR